MAQEQTFSQLAEAANRITEKASNSTSLAGSLSSYAGVGGIAPDGTMAGSQITSADVSAYSNALAEVQNANYYTARMVLEENHEVAMENLSSAVDSLVVATASFAQVATVAEIAADASTGNVDQQMQAQEMLTSSEYTITSADVAEFNTAASNVESYAQQAAGFLAAANAASITNTADAWAAENNVSMAAYTSITFDATSDLLFMSFATQYGDASISLQGYLGGSFKTAEEIYENAGIAYSGG